MKKTSGNTSYALKRMFAVFAMAAVGTALLINIENLFKHGNTVGLGFTLLNALPYAGLAVVVIGIALFAIRRMKSISEKELTLTGLLIAGTGFFIFLSGLFAKRFFPDAFGLTYVAICAVTVLYLIAYIYQREFFISSVLVVISAFGFYAIYRFSQGSPVYSGRSLPLVIIAAAGCLFIAALAHFVFRKNSGALKIGDKKIHLLPRSFEYRFVYITLGLIAAGLILSLALGFQGAYYTMFAMLILELVYAIYFTARLM